MARASRHRSRTPALRTCNVSVQPDTLPVATQEPTGTQVGGGHRQGSPPPEETPTRLRPRLKPTARSTGVVQQAEHRRARLFEQDSPPPIHVSSAPAPAPAPDAPACTHPSLPPSAGVSVDSPTPARINAPSVPALDAPSSSLLSLPPSVPVPSPIFTTPTPLLVPITASVFPVEPTVTIGDVIAGNTTVVSAGTALHAPADAVSASIDNSSIDPTLLNEPPAQAPIGSHSPDLPPFTQVDLHVPTTRIIPPTPLVADGDWPPSIDPSDPSTPTTGRRSARISQILNNGYESLESVLTDIMGQTSLKAEQILDGWAKNYAHVINATNHWNSYSKYLAKHEEQERNRLGLPADVPITPSVRRDLYNKFKEDNSDTWQEMLEVHDMLEASDLSPRSQAQRALSFNKIRKRVIALLDTAAAKHGFEAAVVVCGKTVNEDASLGFAYMTSGAKEFFVTRCRADDSAMIGHLKAHVYNQVSLEMVNDAFDNTASHGNTGDDTAQNPLGIRVEPLHVPDPAPSQACALSVQLESVDNVAPSSTDALVAAIKVAIITMIKNAGGDISKFRPGNFPWTSLASILAEQGLVVRGWPANVSMPGELRGGSTARAKGISVLKRGELRVLYAAFENNDISMCRIEGKEQRMALSASRAPVIFSAAPPADSSFTNGQRMYSDASIDFEGLPRLPACAATTRIKCRPAHHARATADDPITVSSGDDCKSLKCAKEVLTKKTTRDKADKKKARWVDIDSSDDEPCVIPVKGKGERVAISSSTDEARMDARWSTTLVDEQDDYQLPGPSRKRKANGLEGDRPSRKPASTTDHALAKGKARDVDQKGGDRQGSKRSLPKGSLFLDSDSDLADSGDELAIFDVKAPRETAEAIDKSTEPAAVDPFLSGFADPSSGTLVFHDPRPPLASAERPSSPSPKRREPLKSLTKSSGPHNPENHPPLIHESVASRADHSTVVEACDNNAPVDPPNLIGRTQVGGGYPFAGQALYGMVGPQCGYQDARAVYGDGIYCDEMYPKEMYHNDIYRGDPCGIYGGLHPRRGGNVFPDRRRSRPRYPLAYVNPHHLGPGPALPRASRSPSLSDFPPSLEPPQHSGEPGL